MVSTRNTLPECERLTRDDALVHEYGWHYAKTLYRTDENLELKVVRSACGCSVDHHRDVRLILKCDRHRSSFGYEPRGYVVGYATGSRANLHEVMAQRDAREALHESACASLCD